MKIEVNIPIKGIMKIIGIILIIGIMAISAIKFYDYETNWHEADWDICDSIEDKEGVAYITCLDTYSIRGQDADNRSQHVKRLAIKHTILNMFLALIGIIIVIVLIYAIVEALL